MKEAEELREKWNSSKKTQENVTEKEEVPLEGKVLCLYCNI